MLAAARQPRCSACFDDLAIKAGTLDDVIAPLASCRMTFLQVDDDGNVMLRNNSEFAAWYRQTSRFHTPVPMSAHCVRLHPLA